MAHGQKKKAAAEHAFWVECAFFRMICISYWLQCRTNGDETRDAFGWHSVRINAHMLRCPANWKYLISAHNGCVCVPFYFVSHSQFLFVCLFLLALRTLLNLTLSKMAIGMNVNSINFIVVNVLKPVRSIVSLNYFKGQQTIVLALVQVLTWVKNRPQIEIECNWFISVVWTIELFLRAWPFCFFLTLFFFSAFRNVTMPISNSYFNMCK